MSFEDITIKDFDVEVYAQDVNEPHHSTGVYSVKNDEWLVEPEKQEVADKALPPFKS